MRYLFIMDFDGPLADSLAHYEEVHRLTFDALARPVPFDRFSDWYNSEWEQNWLACGFSTGQLPHVFRVFGSFLDYSKVTPQPFLAEQLSLLHQRGRLVVGSTTSEDTIDTFLSRHNLRSYFDGIFGPQPSKAVSDKTEIFRTAMQRFEALPDHTVIIGDTAADIRPARSLGCKSIGVAYGWYGKTRLEREKPTALVEAPETLAATVMKVLGA